MSNPVIHFTNLTDLLAELEGYGPQAVRVTTLQRSESKNGQFPYTLITISVDVRAFAYNGAILSYRPMQEEIRCDITTDRDQINKKYDQAWQDAQAVRLSIYGAIREAGHNPRPGIIDLGEAQPILGEKWLLGEKDHA